MNVKRDFSKAILDLDGKPVRLGASMESFAEVLKRLIPLLTDEQQTQYQKILEEECGKALTLGAAASGALVAPLNGEQNLDPGETVTRLGLAMMIHAGGVVEISTEQRDKIKAVVVKRYNGALIPGRVLELMETDG